MAVQMTVTVEIVGRRVNGVVMSEGEAAGTVRPGDRYDMLLATTRAAWWVPTIVKECGGRCGRKAWESCDHFNLVPLPADG